LHFLSIYYSIQEYNGSRYWSRPIYISLHRIIVGVMGFTQPVAEMSTAERKNVFGSRVRPMLEADNLTAI
jgi:hypothetical protein